MTDYDALRDGLQQAIPFNNHLGLEVVEIAEGRGVVRLPDEDKLHNHVGSQHAGGLFAAGEAASGAAFISVFADHMGGVTALAKSAEIEYQKLAKGEITATGKLDRSARELIDDIDGEEGKAEFPVEVEMQDESGKTVAAMTVRWHVRRTESSE
jgi:acyl-coenzyme A thioesterase PaaI-like protein